MYDIPQNPGPDSDGASSQKAERHKYVVHLTSGTHWDRKWRYTAEQSKLRRAELMDHVFEVLEKHPDYKQFQLDGGSVMLEDYLTMQKSTI